MNTKNSAAEKSTHTDETPNQASHGPSQLEKLQQKRGFLRYIIGIVSCVAMLILGFGEHRATVAPLEKELLCREVRSIAQEIDSTVKFRSAVISMAAGTIEVDALLANSRLDKFLETLRGQLPDFLSMEIISDRGEVVAMIGDLPLSQAGIPGQSRANRFVRVSSDIKSNEGLFIDDPATGSFSVTCRHVGSEKSQWFSRSRFSRDSIDQLLSSFPNRKVALVQVAGGPKVARPNNDWNVAATSGGWWQGAGKAEALLASPGWIVRVENTSGGSVFRSLPVLVPSILLCVIAIAFVSRMFSGASSGAQPQGDAISTQSFNQDADPRAEGTPVSPDSAAVALEEHADSLEIRPEHSAETDLLALAADSPPQPDDDLPKCAVPCCAIAVSDLPQTQEASAVEQEVVKCLPEEIELPDELFATLSASSEVTVAAVLEHAEFATDSDLPLDETDLTLVEAAIVCGDTEVIVGEPMPIELEYPADPISPDPYPDPQVARFYSAVILGPPATSKKDRCTRQEALMKGQDEDFPETIELSWTEPVQPATVDGSAELDDEKSAQEKKTGKETSWGQYTS